MTAVQPVKGSSETFFVCVCVVCRARRPPTGPQTGGGNSTFAQDHYPRPETAGVAAPITLHYTDIIRGLPTHPAETERVDSLAARH